MLPLFLACTTASIAVDPGRPPREDATDAPIDSAPDTSDDTSGDTSDVSPSPVLELHFIDVGQGDAALLRTPSGRALLVDAGDTESAATVLGYLDALGIDRLDGTVVSHQHADHMGSMAEVFRAFPDTPIAWDGGSWGSTDSFHDYRNETDDRRTTVVAGDTIDLDEDVAIDVLHGDVGDWENENNNSVVLRVTHGEVRFLLGGDCEFPVCESALEGVGPIDVYKVHHHGASDATSRRLMREMQPRLAVISVAEWNDYGHPSEEALANLDEVGSTVLRTDESGDIVVRSDGETITY